MTGYSQGFAAGSAAAWAMDSKAVEVSMNMAPVALLVCPTEYIKGYFAGLKVVFGIRKATDKWKAMWPTYFS